MLRYRVLLCLLVLGVPGLGCGLLQSPSSSEEPKPEKVYKGLAGQNCAVMVYADWRTRVDNSRIQGDLAKLVQERLETMLSGDSGGKKKDSSSVAQFLNPLSVVQYQRAHPEIEGSPITEVAPRLGVSRLIYIELENFSVQSPESIMILKGVAMAKLQVLEISGGRAVVAFEEPGINAHYPPDAPEGVMPSEKYNVRSVYNGTLAKLADRIALRFER